MEKETDKIISQVAEFDWSDCEKCKYSNKNGACTAPDEKSGYIPNYDAGILICKQFIEKNKEEHKRKIPESFWIIIDNYDEQYIFKSEKEAQKTLINWKEDAKDYPDDPVWDMEGPYEYKLNKK